MKYFALLISLYCMVLAILPCQDREDVSAKSTPAIIQESHAASDGCNQEICSPFCNCSCCSSARYLGTRPALPVYTKLLVSIYPRLTTPEPQSHAISIWQPPQIS